MKTLLFCTGCRKIWTQQEVLDGSPDCRCDLDLLEIDSDSITRDIKGRIVAVQQATRSRRKT